MVWRFPVLHCYYRIFANIAPIFPLRWSKTSIAVSGKVQSAKMLYVAKTGSVAQELRSIYRNE
nr:MAG TPA: hypothetical protein [Caudoviricetes sp.]